MEINTSLTNYILIQNNFIDEKILDTFKKNINENVYKFNKSSIISNSKPIVDESIRKTEVFSFGNKHNSFTYIHWSNIFYRYMLNGFEYYKKKFKYANFSTIESIQLLKYTEGGFYKYHIDHAFSVPRTLSAVAFINDDYEGGNLVFKFNENELEIPVESNKLIIWPSNFLYPHAVKPVTKGIKYSLVSWAL